MLRASRERRPLRFPHIHLEGMFSRRLDLSEVDAVFEALKTGEVIRQVVQVK